MNQAEPVHPSPENADRGEDLHRDRVTLRPVNLPPLPCPCCARPMRARSVEELTINGCGSCGGVWLDNGATVRLTAGELPAEMPPLALAVHQFAYDMQLRGVASLREAPRHLPEGPRHCPVCSEPLACTRVFKTEVDVDVCSDHGTYFDPAELGQLHHHFLLEKSRGEVAAADFAQHLAETRPYADREVAYAIWGIPVLWKWKR